MNSRTARYCAFTAPAVMALLTVPAQRLAHSGPADAPPSAASAFAADGVGRDYPCLPTGEVGARAERLLTRLAPAGARRHVSITPAIASRAGGGADQRLWHVTCAVAPPPGAGWQGGQIIGLFYDADTGGLIYASTTLGQRRCAGGREGAPPLSAGQAVRAARAWLPKLGLAGGQGDRSGAVASPPLSAPVLSPPRRLPGTRQWLVWLRGREAAPAGAAPLTVAVTVDGHDGSLRSATVAEHAANPHIYLPRPCRAGATSGGAAAPAL